MRLSVAESNIIRISFERKNVPRWHSHITCIGWTAVNMQCHVCVCVIYLQASRRLGVTEVRTLKGSIASRCDGISQRANSLFFQKPQMRHQYDFEEFCLCVNNHMKNGVTEGRLLNDARHFMICNLAWILWHMGYPADKYIRKATSWSQGYKTTRNWS